MPFLLTEAFIAILKLMRYIRQVFKISANPLPFTYAPDTSWGRPLPNQKDYCTSPNREALYLSLIDHRAKAKYGHLGKH